MLYEVITAADVYFLNNVHLIVSLVLTLLFLVPLYFIYSVFALGKYKDSKKASGKNQGIPPNMNKQAISTKSFENKKDYGKVLDFPGTNQKKKHK